MKRLWMILILVQAALFGSAQTYYDFYYTNLPVARLSAYTGAFRSSFDRLYLSGYSDTCTTCSPIAPSLQKEQLSQLRQELLSYLSPDLYQKFQVPGSYYHIVGTKTAPYIIRTLYTIKDDEVVPQYQVKVTFTNDPVPAVADIQVYAPKEGKRFSRKLVLTSYRKMVAPGR
ncbi:MAG: hypothetical protein EOO08_13335 [Chitinophagaceae bacterium]|nr:MAG: hypothetical protein EOO08_13335 [Chitinophagaceae bacterium]